ncbi:hypothetical protein MNBD_PLANCTO03-959 [hydrothermal vent metagenome]|uniref:Uncharacterized protein n=1 Tax=hydrothermal vent metagenome TaxID=652676 RepID=A0A3B1DJ59_9ZZZZ
MRFFPRAAILDDTGKPCEIVSIWQLRWDERQSDPAFAAAVHRLSRALVANYSGMKVAAPIMLWVLGGMFTSITLLAGYSLLLSWLVWAPPALALYWIMRRGDLQRIVRQTIDVLLVNGICPGCAYNLAGLPEEDGLIGCSECGAAWMRSRIARFHSFGQRAERSETRPLRLWWERVKAFEPYGPTSIYDDRSFVRPVVSPRLAWPIRAAENEHHDRLVEAREEMISHGSIRRLLTVCVIPFFAYPIIVVNLRTDNPLNIALGLLLLPMMVYSGIFTLRGAVGIKAQHIKDAMLRYRLCPSCASDLMTDDQPEVQGFCTCPECGAAWRLREEPGSQSPALDETRSVP